MITLTTPVVLRITKLRVLRAVGLDQLDDASEATVYIEAGNAGGAVESHAVIVRDGRCQGLAESRDRLVTSVALLPTALTDLRTVLAAAVGVAAKKDAIETWLLGQGLVPAGTVT